MESTPVVSRQSNEKSQQKKSGDMTPQREPAVEGLPAMLSAESELPQPREGRGLPEILYSDPETPIRSKRFEQECLPDRGYSTRPTGEPSTEPAAERALSQSRKETAVNSAPPCEVRSVEPEADIESKQFKRLPDPGDSMPPGEPYREVLTASYDWEPVAAIKLEEFEQERSPDSTDLMLQREPSTEPSGKPDVSTKRRISLGAILFDVDSPCDTRIEIKAETDIIQKQCEEGRSIRKPMEENRSETDPAIISQQCERETLPACDCSDYREGAGQHLRPDNSAVVPGTEVDMVTPLGVIQRHPQLSSASRCLEPEADIRTMTWPIIRPTDETPIAQLAEVWPKLPFEEVDSELSPSNGDSTGLRVCFPFNRRGRSGEPARRDECYNGERLEAELPLLCLSTGSRSVEEGDGLRSERPRDAKLESGCYAFDY